MRCATRSLAGRASPAVWSGGRETVSFDGRHLEKRPDLSIQLTCRNPSFPLVAECKLIDSARRKTVALYCADGLARFVQGQYAWAGREAFMIAYVRDSGSIAAGLVPHLAACRTVSVDPNATESLPTPIPDVAADLAWSVHGRRFSYLPPVPTAEPGPINLWHLWLPVGG